MEFGTGLSAQQILSGAQYTPEIKAQARNFYRNGKGRIIGQPYLFPAFFRNTANLVQEIEKEINDIKPIKIFVQDPKWFVDRYITYVGFGLGEQVENAEEAQQFLGKKRFASAKVVKYEEPFLYVDKFSEQMIAQGDSGGPMLYIDAQGEYLIRV